MGKIVKYFFVSLFLLICQLTLSQFLSITEITPDFLVVWIVYIALKQGQLEAILWGFGLGLFYDFLVDNLVGLSAFTKMLAGFIAGYFYNENKLQIMLGSYRFLLVVFLSSLIHNIVYFSIFTRGSDLSFAQAFIGYGLTTTFYTVIISTLPMFMFSRKYPVS